MTNSTRKLILVTGTPGTGKTRFSILLAKRIGAQYTPFGRLVETQKLYSGSDRIRNSRIVNIAKTRAYLSKLASEAERLIIIDSHISGICPEKFTRKVFVLRCDPRTLKKRLLSRDWSDKKVQENVLAEILDVCFSEAVSEYGARRVEEIVTSGSDVEGCVRFAKRILSRRKTKRMTVDWLSQITRYASLRYLQGLG